ncbi:MAG: riboflavin synthase [Planctomycetota bacterium]
MFTGIVTACARLEEISSVNADGSRRLRVATWRDARTPGACAEWEGLTLGESICVAGVCLTLVEMDGARIGFDVVPETLRRTTLGVRAAGSQVNLERALRAGDRYGGHYVTGHIDTTGRITGIHDSAEMTITIDRAPTTAAEFCVIPKGSVTVDGVSLTIAQCDAATFRVALVPHTLSMTSFGLLRVGDAVNLEMDQFGKWVAHLMPRVQR